MSLLLWERGLKFKSGLITLEYYSVAPLVGAWIEIGRKGSLRQLQPGSLLLWERGLKYASIFADLYRLWSLLLWERGLK